MNGLSAAGLALLSGPGRSRVGREQRRLTVVNWVRSMWARLFRRGRRSGEHEFHDQHEASRYRAEAERRGQWNPPGGDSL
jgi:hypothetical protein